MKLGLVGKNGSGKTAVCNALKEKGFQVYSLSDIVRREVAKRGLESNRDHLVATANQLKEEQGAAVLAIQSIAYANEQNVDKVVFDSIRNRDEINYLRSQDVVIIGVDADIKVRYERIQSRQSDTDQIDFETFKSHDERENTGVSSGQNINEALSLCRVVIDNNGTYEDLIKKIDTFLIQNFAQNQGLS